MLSHHNLGGDASVMPKSRRGAATQRTSTIVFATYFYSALVLDLETVSCFLEFQVIRLEPRRATCPICIRECLKHTGGGAGQ
jgi:hypothetical protein